MAHRHDGSFCFVGCGTILLMPTKTKKKNVARKTVAKSRSAQQGNDGTFLLKIVLYIIVGSVWLRFADPVTIGAFVFNGLPVGLVVGLLFASHDHFQIDRKLEYVVLIMVAVLSYFLPIGIVL